MPAKQPLPAPFKIMQVNLWLRVENNNEHIRGKKKVREEIEDRVLNRYQMRQERPDGWDYQLSIPYETDKGPQSPLEPWSGKLSHKGNSQMSCRCE